MKYFWGPPKESGLFLFFVAFLLKNQIDVYLRQLAEANLGLADTLSGSFTSDCKSNQKFNKKSSHQQGGPRMGRLQRSHGWKRPAVILTAG